MATNTMPRARLTIPATSDPRTIAGASLVSRTSGAPAPASERTGKNGARLTAEMARVAAASATRLRPDADGPASTALMTRLPAAAAVIHWATLKQALTGWMRITPSESATASPMASTASTPDRTSTTGTKTASNRSMASTSSRYWNSTWRKRVTVSTARNSRKVVQAVRWGPSQAVARTPPAIAAVASTTVNRGTRNG